MSMSVTSFRIRVLGVLALIAALLAAVPAAAAHAAASTPATTSTVQTATAHSCTYRSTVGYTCDYYYGTATISEGSSNADAVREIQDIINHHTDYPTLLSVDGSFGPATLTAVKWLQSQHNITGGPDGIVGTYTWDYLRR